MFVQQEWRDSVHESVELIVVQPVTGSGNIDHGRVAEKTGSTIEGWIAGPAVLTTHQQHRARDGAPHLVRLLRCHIEQRHVAQQWIVLPAIPAIFLSLTGVSAQVSSPV